MERMSAAISYIGKKVNMGQIILGLDIGSYSIKGVLIDNSFRRYEIIEFIEQPILYTENNIPDISQSLLAFHKQIQTKPQIIISAVNDPAFVIKQFSLPFVQTKQITKTIDFELADRLPFSLDGKIYDYRITSQKDGHSEITAGVVSAVTLEEQISVMRNCGIDAKILDLAPNYYQTFISLLKSELYQNMQTDREKFHIEADKTEPILVEKYEQGAGSNNLDSSHSDNNNAFSAIIDMGHTKTEVIVVNSKGMVASRTFAFGGYDFTLEIAKEFGISENEAILLKHENKLNLEDDGLSFLGTEQEEDANKRQKIIKIIQKTADSFLNQLLVFFLSVKRKYHGQIISFFGCGGSFSMRGLATLIENRFNIRSLAAKDYRHQMQRIQASEEMIMKGSLSFCMAARTIVGVTSSEFNFRKDQFAYTGDWNVVKPLLVRAVIMILIVIFMGGLYTGTKLSFLRAQEKRIDEKLKIITKRTVGREISDYKVALVTMNAPSGEMKNLVPDVTAFYLLGELSKRIPTNSNIKVKELSIGGGKVRAKGEADTFEEVDKMLEQVKTFECFEKLNKGRTQKVGGNSKRVEFNFTVDSKC